MSIRAYRCRKGKPSEVIAVPAGMAAPGQEVRGALLERLADHNDTLLEKLIEEVVPSTEEIYAQLRADLAGDAVVEVLLGAAESDNGVQRLWKALRHACTSPDCRNRPYQQPAEQGEVDIADERMTKTG